MPPPPSNNVTNKSYFKGNPSGNIPARVIKPWDLPKTYAQEEVIYADVMSKDIALIHERVRLYIESSAKEQAEPKVEDNPKEIAAALEKEVNGNVTNVVDNVEDTSDYTDVFG